MIDKTNELPEDILKIIQNCISLRPVIILGSGASCQYGIAGMPELARYLIDNITSEPNDEVKWNEFKKKIEGGADLEGALQQVTLSDSLEKKIINKTRELILLKDRKVLKQSICKRIEFPLSIMLQHLIRTANPNIKIITTNYDRIAEYAIDQASLVFNNGFSGKYIQYFEGFDLTKMQVNRLVALRSSRAGQHLIGIVQKIIRNMVENGSGDGSEEIQEIESEKNIVRITLIGTFFDRLLTKENVFRRTLETVPEIDALCYSIEGKRLTDFMKAISYQTGSQDQSLSLGSYTIDDEAVAYLDANRFFQRHAVIVGSTGSGKSWTTAKLIEQVSELSNSNAILFDIHGEYDTIQGDGIHHYRIAGHSDVLNTKGINEGILFFPYWLLGYEDMIMMLVDRSDQNAPNQAMVLSRTVTNSKKAFLEKEGEKEILDNFTIDSPVPYDIDKVLEELYRLDSEMVPSSRGEKQGEFHGRLSRFIARLENKKTDRRLSFILNKFIDCDF